MDMSRRRWGEIDLSDELMRFGKGAKDGPPPKKKERKRKKKRIRRKK